MFSWFRRLLRAIQAVGDAVIQIVAVLRELLDKLGNDSALEARVEELERSRALWEAEIEAQGVKVEARVRALRATEERIRLANGAPMKRRMMMKLLEALQRRPHGLNLTQHMLAEATRAQCRPCVRAWRIVERLQRRNGGGKWHYSSER